MKVKKNSNVVQKSFYINLNVYDEFVTHCKNKSLIKSKVIAKLIKGYIEEFKNKGII